MPFDKAPHHIAPEIEAALERRSESYAPSPENEALALKLIEQARPIAELALADARHVAFRDPPPIPRFMA